MITPSNAGKLFDPLTVTRLPARLDADHTARLLGFQRHDIPILMQAKLLKPLGKPVANAPKYFMATAVEELRADQRWLDTATRALTDYWKCKNDHRPEPQEAAPAL